MCERLSHGTKWDLSLFYATQETPWLGPMPTVGTSYSRVSSSNTERRFGVYPCSATFKGWGSTLRSQGPLDFPLLASIYGRVGRKQRSGGGIVIY
ncbi:hypothetical protein K431DRAFT_283875 [Polychaeton citri CBS 116435]|uniref:Uncharacterized protein n=1 Tax=Polychaeton citri CBS 116435 TaxID=1314669 RepID=A0A9P4Q8B3_9PEZI|nr:hypothetical protein K431DRAFT_283875 [Polychaeton citri CBS 116435]